MYIPPVPEKNWKNKDCHHRRMAGCVKEVVFNQVTHCGAFALTTSNRLIVAWLKITRYGMTADDEFSRHGRHMETVTNNTWEKWRY